MKKQIKIYFLIAVTLFVSTAIVNAQQKASDQSFEEEKRKVNEKKAARYAFINRMRQSIPVDVPAATPAGPGTNTNANATEDPRPATTVPATTGLKPSQQTMVIPGKKAGTGN